MEWINHRTNWIMKSKALFLLLSLQALCVNCFITKGLLRIGHNASISQQRLSIGSVSRRCANTMRLDLTGGSYVALITPMKETGDIDELRLRELINWHLESNTDGLVVLGTTGEASTLDNDERNTVLRITQEEVLGKIPVIVGTGGINPLQVIANTKIAAESGADACLVVTPYYVKPTQAGLVKFFTHVANSVDLPMVLYNVPGRTGVDMGLDTVKECSRHPRIVGIKEATGDNSRVGPLREACGKDFLLYSGDDENACEFVLQGGNGVISVTSNVAPKIMHQVMAAAQAGLVEEAKALNEPLNLLHDRLFIASNPIPAKWALHRMNKIDFPTCRLPLTDLEYQHFGHVEEALRLGKCI